ncbi:polysaccharide export protein [Halomonas sp. CH40]
MNRKILFLPAVAVFFGVVLSGCALAPGGNIEYRTESPPLDDLVDIEPITPGLVSTYRSVVSRAQPLSAEQRQAFDDYEYLVGPGDVLSIIVYNHPELTNPFGAGSDRSLNESGNLVQSDGNISYPFIGTLEAEGRTVKDIQQELSRRLSEYLTDPQVVIRVAAFESQKVFLSGAVGSARALPITNTPLTIIDAISQAGGLADNANWHDAVLNRNGQEREISLYALLKEGDLSQNLLLEDGDVLHVPTSDNQAVAVMGQVRAPGSLRMGADRFSLTDAISRAGGLDETQAAPSGIFVLRRQSEESDKLATVYQLDIRNATAFMVGSQFTLEPRDVVYVTTAPIARWNRVIDLLLPSMDFPGDGVNMRDSVEELL